MQLENLRRAAGTPFTDEDIDAALAEEGSVRLGPYATDPAPTHVQTYTNIVGHEGEE